MAGMIHSLVMLIGSLIEPWGALGVFAGAVLEEVIAPIPSSAVQMTSGFILFGGHALTLSSFALLIVIVAVPAAVGVTVGSLLYYGIAYNSGRPILERYGKYIGLSWREIERLQKSFTNSSKDELMILTARVIPFVPSVAIAAFCGLFRVSLKKYVILTFVGTLLRAIIVGFVGWQAGRVYYLYAEQIDRVERFVFVGIAVLVISFIIYRIIRRRNRLA